MTEAVTTTAAVCVATGTFGGIFCAAFGFDPTLLAGGMLGGLMGCLIVQTLIPDKAEVQLRRFLTLTIGSVLLATISTALFSPWVIRTANLEEVPPGMVRLGVGAFIGGFAQPLVVLGWAWFAKKFLGVVDQKENPSA